jgi:hypothetical protein
MSTKTIYLAIVAAVAAAPAVHAMPVAVPQPGPGIVADNGDMPRMSDAARNQILGSPNIYLATYAKPKPFVQMGKWMQTKWAGQMRL